MAGWSRSHTWRRTIPVPAAVPGTPRARGLWPLLALLAATACGPPATLEELAPDSTCRRTVLVGPATADSALRERLTVRWILPDETTQVRRLNAWCAAVGPALVGGWGEQATEVDPEVDPGADPRADPGAIREAPPVILDSIAVVSWNEHVGGGDLRRLVRDLREGRLTRGGPVEHFVLLLQETYRGGEQVPPFDARRPGGSDITAVPPGGERTDITEDAEALGLHLFYAPSMRNGRGEDRGNAILSTLPLQDLVAIPLPVARQRRLALAGTVAGATTDGRPWQLQVASVHLESDAEGIAGDEAARMLQVEALLEGLPESEAAVAGGDFNTRRRGRDADLVGVMLRAYPQTPPFPPGPTYVRAWGIYRLYLDYIFFRLPDRARARYDRILDPYNSDHHPLVGWVVLDP